MILTPSSVSSVTFWKVTVSTSSSPGVATSTGLSCVRGPALVPSAATIFSTRVVSSRLERVRSLDGCALATEAITQSANADALLASRVRPPRRASPT